MDSPILPILIGGAVLGGIVLATRSASAQDDDYGDGYDYGGGDYGGGDYGGGDYGGGDAGGYAGGNGGGSADGGVVGGGGGGGGGGGDGGGGVSLPDIPGGVTPPGPTQGPGEALLTVTVDPGVESGTLYVTSPAGSQNWPHREGDRTVVRVVGPPGRWYTFVRSATRRTAAGQAALATTRAPAQIPADERRALYLRPRADSADIPLANGGTGSLSITVRNDVPPESEVVVTGYDEEGRRTGTDYRADTRVVQARGRLEISAVPPGLYHIEARMGGRRVSTHVRARVRAGQVTSLGLTAPDSRVTLNMPTVPTLPRI